MCVSAAGWGRLQYESWDNEKVEAVGNRAWGAFLRAVAWSGYKRKDGWISAAAMRKIEPDTRVWDRLRAGGMLEPREDGAASLHGWSEHNETTVRRAEREESYSRRGKAGAATRWGDGNSHASGEASPLETDERSRSRSRSEKRDQDHGDPRSRGPFKDPAGIAPPGENPDAYPGSVTPQLELVPPDPKPSKPDPVRQVFDAYLDARAAKRGGGHPPVLSDKRRSLVKARLKDHPVEQLVAAARGIWESAFHVEKGFTEFDLAMRDAEHVERFAPLGAPKPPQRLPDHPPRKINTLEELDAWHAELRAEAKRKAHIVGPSALPFARDMYDDEPVEGGT